MEYPDTSRQKAKQFLAELDTARQTLASFHNKVQDMKDYTIISKETFDTLLNSWIRKIIAVGVNWPADFDAAEEIRETAKEFNTKWWGNEPEFKGNKTHLFKILFGDASSISDIPQGKARVKRLKAEFEDFYHLAKTICEEVSLKREDY